MRIPLGLTMLLALAATPVAAEESGAEFPSVGGPDVRANVMQMLERSRQAQENQPDGSAPEPAPAGEPKPAPRSEPKRAKRPPQPRVIRRPVEHTELPETTITIREYLDVDLLEMAIDEANRKQAGQRGTSSAE